MPNKTTNKFSPEVRDGQRHRVGFLALIEGEAHIGMPHNPPPPIFDSVLADIPPTVADALFAAWRDPSPDAVMRAQLAITLHLSDLDARSSAC